jgi:chromosome segregation ATPase
MEDSLFISTSSSVRLHPLSCMAPPKPAPDAASSAASLDWLATDPYTADCLAIRTRAEDSLNGLKKAIKEVKKGVTKKTLDSKEHSSEETRMREFINGKLPHTNAVSATAATNEADLLDRTKTLRERLKRDRNEHRRMKSSERMSTDKCNKLVTETEDLRKLQEGSETECKKLKDDVKELQSQLTREREKPDKAEELREQLTRERKKFEGDIAKLQEDLTTERKNSKKEIDDHKDQLTKLTEQSTRDREKSEKEIKELKEQLRAERDEHSVLKKAKTHPAYSPLQGPEPKRQRLEDSAESLSSSSTVQLGSNGFANPSSHTGYSRQYGLGSFEPRDVSPTPAGMHLLLFSEIY